MTPCTPKSLKPVAKVDEMAFGGREFEFEPDLLVILRLALVAT